MTESGTVVPVRSSAPDLHDGTTTPAAARHLRPARGVRRAVRATCWLVTTAVLLVLAVSVLVPRIAGATPYTVLTGSMRPDLPPGTLVVVKPAATDDIRIGDVVTYQLESGERAVVTHRVTGIGFDGKGRRVFTTQGDANAVADAEPVLPVQVRGRLWYSVPYVGRLTHAITGTERHIATVVVVSGLLGYAAVMIGATLLDLAKRRRVGHRAEEKTHA